jgi:uncharacterized protein
MGHQSNHNNIDLPTTMSAESESKCPKPGVFCWNELVAVDEAAATKFYTALFGWKTQPFGGSTDYTLFMKGDTTVGGMMKCPKPGLPSHWLAYVTVEDVDAAAATAAKLGGKVVMPPFDVPTVGRIAVLTDPQGAAIAILRPSM